MFKAITAFVILGLSGSAFASSAIDLKTIARNSRGKIIEMNYYTATDYCEDRGQRIPTAREWAEFSVEHGAKGILPAAVDQKTFDLIGPLPNGYGLVDRRNKVGDPVDAFFFNPDGYVGPALKRIHSGEPIMVWTSSSSPYRDTDLSAFMPENGEIGYPAMGARDTALAVVCISNK